MQSEGRSGSKASKVPAVTRPRVEDLADWQDEFENHAASNLGRIPSGTGGSARAGCCFRRARKEPGPAMDLQIVNCFEEVLTEGD